MKVKKLIEIVDNQITLEVDGQTITEADLELEIDKLVIYTKREKESLETLGYSFEAGV